MRCTHERLNVECTALKFLRMTDLWPTFGSFGFLAHAAVFESAVIGVRCETC